jgi:hypothetical protein
MKTLYKIITITLLFHSSIRAQMPTDALMMDKGQLCIAATYTHDTWNEYWEGTLKRDNQNVGTLTRQTVMPMIALGLFKRVNVLAALPWVRTEASGGQIAGASGLQDASIWLKATALDLQMGNSGRFTAHAVAGFSTPASSYLPDYAPLNLGFGCSEGSLRGILQYQLDDGPYVRGMASYHWRGYSQIERNYYYTDRGYYSDKVNMPNAVMYGATLGSWLFNKSLQIEATYDGLNTLSGHDIRRQDVGFPSNRMVFTRVGGFIHYFTPFVKGLGVIASGNYILTGRNVGQSTQLTGGLTYQFGVWK